MSNVEGETDLYFYHDASPINTLSSDVSKFQNAVIKNVKKIHTKSLNSILQNFKINRHIDYMNIDVEGYEEKVLEGFDLNRYRPSIISIEYLDLKMKKLEFKNNNIDNLIQSNLYKYLIDNDYFFVNWLHGDLIFVHKDFRD